MIQISKQSRITAQSGQQGQRHARRFHSNLLQVLDGQGDRIIHRCLLLRLVELALTRLRFVVYARVRRLIIQIIKQCEMLTPSLVVVVVVVVVEVGRAIRRTRTALFFVLARLLVCGRCCRRKRRRIERALFLFNEKPKPINL